jgi:hypothetical protein
MTGEERSDGVVTLTIRPDMTKFVLAMRDLTRGVQRAAEAMQRAGLSVSNLSRVWRRHEQRQRHGPCNFVGALWQSDLCTAWVHGSCPLPGDCDCTCHGGRLR